ncbi:MAG: Rieske (2Fe-2S) protein [Actinomycetes bacterium]
MHEHQPALIPPTPNLPAEGPSRRDVLRGVAAAGVLGLGAVGLSACAGQRSSTLPTGVDQTGGGSFANPQGTAGSVISTTILVPQGGSVIVNAGGPRVAISQPAANEYRAFSARCTHMGCIVSPGNSLTLRCPCHGSIFNAATGAVLRGPATISLPAITIAVKGGNIVLEEKIPANIL